MTPKDLELLAQLETLAGAALREIENYRKGSSLFNSEDYNKYRVLCFSMIDKPFWDIAKQMELKVEPYEKGKGYEERIDNYLKACSAYRDGGWLSNALVEVGLSKAIPELPTVD